MTTVDPTADLAGTNDAPSTSTARMAVRVRGLRTRAAGGGLDRALLVVGGVLLPLGIAVVLLGWLGASRTVLLFEQVPYLVSGGMLGLALVVVGGFVYFAYWQTLLVRESRALRRDLNTGLDRLASLLDERLPAPLPAARGRAAATGSFVATGSGTMFHRPDCTVVAGKTGLRRVAADAPGMEPCRICDPLGS